METSIPAAEPCLTPPVGDAPEETIATAGLTEVFAAITLANPTWTIIRHPFRFERYRSHPGAAIHYLYSALILVLLMSNWTSPQEADGGDVAPLIQLINRGLAPIGPHARLDPGDALAVTLLIGNMIGGVTAYAACRLLARWGRRRSAADASGGLAAQTIAATAYLGGACSVLFAIGLLLGMNPSHDNDQSLAGTAVGLLILFLVYCWGVWIRRIHDVLPGKVTGALFPYFLGFASLAIFAGIVGAVKILLS